MEYYAIYNEQFNELSASSCIEVGAICIPISKDIFDNIDKYIYKDGEIVLDQNYNNKQEERREAEFNKAFFNTSLGYVRRTVTMADGSKKDFLSDLMPTIKMGLESGIAVNILTYDKPPFDHDIEDWTEYQHKVIATPQFIQECFMQLSNDFFPINEEVE